MHILLSALSCNAASGSEALVGYHYAQGLAMRHEVTVIAARPAAPPDGVECHVIDIGTCNLNDVSAQALMQFELRQLPKIWQLHRQKRFDVIHRVTPSAIQNPTFLPPVKTPLVIGPLLAANRPPDCFEPYLRRPFSPPVHSKLHPYRIAAGLSRRVLSAAACSQSYLRRAKKILAGTQIAMDRLPPECRDRCEVITYSGVEHDVFVPPAQRPEKSTVTLLYVGRLVHYKGPELLLRAAALAARKCALRLQIVGGGDPVYMDFCRGVASELGLANVVEFIPSMPRSELPRLYQQADIFCFPTLCDTYGIALLEAMSCGCAVVVSDVAGPHEIVAESTGIKVPLVEPEQYLTAYAEAIVNLAGDPGLRRRLGQLAREHILEHHGWQRISARLLNIYEQFEGR